jgi:hypothetical protein
MTKRKSPFVYLKKATTPATTYIRHGYFHGKKVLNDLMYNL